MRVMAALLLAALAASPRQDAELKRLVEQLDAEELAERERARDELLKKGRSIAPFLKKFADSHAPEVSSQVRAILARFEWEEGLEQSLPPARGVTIPKGKHTPEHLISELRRQAGLRVSPLALNVRAPVEAGWENAPPLRVLDDLCRALGKGRPELPALQSRSFGGRGWNSDLSPSKATDAVSLDGAKPLDPAVAHWGQFRAVVRDLEVTEVRSLKKGSVTALLQVSVGALPGTQPVFIGGWRVEEAVDDKGASRVLEEGGRGRGLRAESEPDTGEDLNAVWFVGERGWGHGAGQTAVSIKIPTPGARRLTKLRLKLRVAFAVKEITKTLAVKDLKEKAVLEMGAGIVTVTKTETKERAFHMNYLVGGRFRGSPAFVPLDDRGREIETGGGGSGSGGAEFHQHWYLRGGAEVAAVRTSAWLGHKTFDIPFEFADIPLPGEE